MASFLPDGNYRNQADAIRRARIETKKTGVKHLVSKLNKRRFYVVYRL